MKTDRAGRDVKKIRRYPEDGTLLTTGETLHLQGVSDLGPDREGSHTRILAHVYRTASGIVALASLDRSPMVRSFTSRSHVLTACPAGRRSRPFAPPSTRQTLT